MIRFRALLIGLGQIGCGYDADLPFETDRPRSSARTYTHARALACHPGFDLQAGIDPNCEARERFKKIYGVNAYSNLSDWRLRRSGQSDPDLVVIAVSPQLQPALVQEVLDSMEPKMLLLEKPIACGLRESLTLKNSCSTYPQVQIAVNYIRRWLPSVDSWRVRLQSGELGRLIYGQLTYGKGLLNNGSHFVNLAEAWLGPLTLGRVIDQGMPCHGFDREASLELLANDHGHAPLQVRSVGMAGMRAGELDLWFEGGRLSWPNHGRAIAFWPRQRPTPEESYASISPDPDLQPTGLEHYQLEVVHAMHRHLLDSSSNPLLCDFSDGLRTFETITPAFS